MVESASGRVHGIASGLGFLLIMVALAATWWIPDLRTVRRTIVGLFLVAVVTFALFLASEDVTTGWLAPTGLYQRFNLVAIYAGLVVVAWVLRRGAGDRGPAAPTWRRRVPTRDPAIGSALLTGGERHRHDPGAAASPTPDPFAAASRHHHPDGQQHTLDRPSCAGSRGLMLMLTPLAASPAALALLG